MTLLVTARYEADPHETERLMPREDEGSNEKAKATGRDSGNDAVNREAEVSIKPGAVGSATEESAEWLHGSS